MLSFLKHRFIHPLLEFINDSKAIGIILLLCTVVSLCITNIFKVDDYINVWNYKFTSNTYFHSCNTPLQVINELLMSLFFVAVTLEIKREFIKGELKTKHQAAMPIIAAIGGMIVPALIFTFFNFNTQNIKGWAIPTATDIAFTIGVASLLGNKVPNSLKIFLMALAIIDDLGAIIIIALFYGSAIEFNFLLLAIIPIIGLIIINKLNKPFGVIQIILGLLIWYFILHSGIHASIAGVVFAAFINKKDIEKLQLKLHNWVYFLIIPLFVLANTSIVINNEINITQNVNLVLGVSLGLVLGKPLGIVLFSFIATKLKLANLPSHINTQKFIGAAMLAGIGFTMSLFVTNLAFKDVTIQNICKIFVLVASVVSAILGVIVIKLSKE